MKDAESTVCFVDCETTGLDPERHEVWEVGLIVDEKETEWQLPVKMERADLMALQVGGFHKRHLQGLSPSNHKSIATDPRSFARAFGRATCGRHLVGACVSFDAAFLAKLLRRQGVLPAWHYHLVDVEAMVAGAYGISPPWNSEALSKLVGVDPADFDRHTALGDARWARAIYLAVMSSSQGRADQP